MTVQYRVTWTPPNQPQRQSTPTTDRDAAMQSYLQAKLMHWSPALEVRTITEWEPAAVTVIP